jgi:hypothetical protein
MLRKADGASILADRHRLAFTGRLDGIEGLRGVAAVSVVSLRLDLGRVRRVLIVTVAALVVLTFIAQFLKDAGWLSSVSRFFDSDVKLNFPSVFKDFAMVVSALGVWAIARVARDEGDPWAVHWRVLAVVIGLLALDEMTFAHQSIGETLSNHFDFTGPLHFAWVVLYLPLALAVFLILARFWWNLPPALRWSFACAGVLFAGGSGGLELIKGSIASAEGQQTLRFYLAAAASDSLEMIGLAILLLTVLRELGRRAGQVSVAIRSS